MLNCLSNDKIIALFQSKAFDDNKRQSTFSMDVFISDVENVGGNGVFSPFPSSVFKQTCIFFLTSGSFKVGIVWMKGDRQTNKTGR